MSPRKLLLQLLLFIIDEFLFIFLQYALNILLDVTAVSSTDQVLLEEFVFAFNFVEGKFVFLLENCYFFIQTTDVILIVAELHCLLHHRVVKTIFVFEF